MFKRNSPVFTGWQCRPGSSLIWSHLLYQPQSVCVAVPQGEKSLQAVQGTKPAIITASRPITKMIVTQPKGMSSGSQSTATKIIPTKIVYGQQGKTQVKSCSPLTDQNFLGFYFLYLFCFIVLQLWHDSNLRKLCWPINRILMNMCNKHITKIDGNVINGEIELCVYMTAYTCLTS